MRTSSQNNARTLAVSSLIIFLVAGRTDVGVAQANGLKPNVVIVISDDSGFSDFGFQNSPSFRTPALDELASNGVFFTTAYASSSVCSPSRAGLITGKNPSRLGLEFNLPGDPSAGIGTENRGLPIDEKTLGNIFTEAGYITGFFGKWHLGSSKPYHPLNRGFSEFFGVLGGFSKYPSGNADNVFSNFNPVDPVSIPYLTDAFGDKAVEFISKNRSDAFLLMVAFTAPHNPMNARSDDLDQFKHLFFNQKRLANAAMTFRMDQNIGRIVAQLKRHNLLKNTIVIFTSDHNGSLDSNGASNGFFRGGKGTVLEGGLRTPLIFSWPAIIQEGFTVDQPVTTLDVFPTLFEILRGDSSFKTQLDGVDLLPVMLDSDFNLDRGSFFWRVNWAAAVRKGDWKLVRTPENQTQLFNLKKDPYEFNDLSGNETSIRNALSETLQEWESLMPKPTWTAHPMWKARAIQRYGN